MIHKLADEKFVISSRQMWKPGCYTAETTARYAFQFSDETLQRLQDEANAANGGTGGAITMAMLKTAKHKRI